MLSPKPNSPHDYGGDFRVHSGHETSNPARWMLGSFVSNFGVSIGTGPSCFITSLRVRLRGTGSKSRAKSHQLTTALTGLSVALR